jgi:hypothetical protein
MTGIIVFTLISLLISEEHQTNSFIQQTNANPMTKIQVLGVQINVPSLTQPLKDYIIPLNIKQILANNSITKKEIAKKENYVLLFTMISNKEIL